MMTDIYYFLRRIDVKIVLPHICQSWASWTWSFNSSQCRIRVVGTLNAHFNNNISRYMFSTLPIIQCVCVYVCIYVCVYLCISNYNMTISVKTTLIWFVSFHEIRIRTIVLWNLINLCLTIYYFHIAYTFYEM